MENFLRNLQLGIRSLLKEPLFACTAITTLSLGIGANTAIFSMINSIFLRPLSYSHPEQLYLIRDIVPQMGVMSGSWPANLRHYDIWKHEARSFEDMAVAEPITLDFSSAGVPRQIDGIQGSSNLLNVLGVPPLNGRTFVAREDLPGQDQVVILTNTFWRNEFHGDPSLIGKTITLNGLPYEVVGILPESFRFPKRNELGPRIQFGSNISIIKPLGLDPSNFHLLGNFRFAAIGRLKQGMTSEQALAELNAVQGNIAAQIGQSSGRNIELRAELIPLEYEVVGAVRKGLLFLLGAVGAVLLIVCANIASLLLAQAPRRIKDMAVRTALGANRTKLTIQVLTELLPLSMIAGLFGIFFAYVSLHWLIKTAPLDLPRLNEVNLDARALFFALFLSIITTLLFGLLPAWRCAHTDLQGLLKSSSPTVSVDRAGLLMRQVLIAFEVGITVLLLIIASTLTISLGRLLNVNKGFRTDRVLTVDVALPLHKYTQFTDRVRFYDEARFAALRLPGVNEAGWVSNLPLEGQANTRVVNIPGIVQQSYENLMANYRYASPGYFKVMGIPVLRGRYFDENDRNKMVTVISQTVANRVWPNEDPIGKQFRPGPNDAPLVTVIGIVGDIRTVRLDQAPISVVYLPYWGQDAPKTASLALRTSMAQSDLIASDVRHLIRQIDPEVPILQMRTMDQVLTESVSGRQFQTSLAYIVSGFALFLAALGIYSVIAYSVEQRRYEIGIRVALGASPSQLRRLIIRQGMIPIFCGLACGTLVAYGVARTLSSLFFEVKLGNPLIICSSVFIMILIAIVATYIPAARAANINPSIALRSQ